MLAGVRALLSDVHVVIFFFLAFCMGIGNGAIGFLFLYLDELGALGLGWVEKAVGLGWGAMVMGCYGDGLLWSP